MFTFLHDIAKPLAENSKMHQQPATVWPTKIILRLLASNLSTTVNQLTATSVLIQQNQHGDYKQNDMASFAEALFKAPTKLERNLLSVYILIHPEQYGNTCMAVLIRRVTCESLFSFWGQRKVLNCKIFLRGRQPCFFHGGSERLCFFELRPSQQPFWRIFR